MSSIRCSKPGTVAIAALVVLGLLVAAAGPAAAFTVSDRNVPDDSQVGNEVSVTYVVDDPYTNTSNQWTLRASTQLRNVSWTVTVLRAGDPIQDGQRTYGNRTIERPLDIENGGDQVRIKLAGTVPAVEEYTYPAEERYRVARLARISGSNTNVFVNDTARHYTPESDDARAAIGEAERAIEAAPGANSGAKDDLRRAKSAYRDESFGLAQDLAEDAQATAQGAQQSRQTLIYAGIAVAVLLVLGLLVGGALYWRSQGDDYGKL